MGSLGETLKDCVSLYSDEYTLKMDLSMNEGDISMEGRCSKEKKHEEAQDRSLEPFYV